jgi:hypothetical protein
MVRVKHVATIPRPPSEVFRVASDPLRQVEWDLGTCLGVEPLTSGRTGKGARYRAHLGRTTIELEVTEFTKDALYTTLGKTRDGLMRSTYTFAAAPAGTTFTQVDELAPNRRGAVLGPLARRRIERRQKQIAERLRRYVYAGGGAAD